jgi:hypothetical protein
VWAVEKYQNKPNGSSAPYLQPLSAFTHGSQDLAFLLDLDTSAFELSVFLP